MMGDDEPGITSAPQTHHHWPIVNEGGSSDVLIVNEGGSSDVLLNRCTRGGSGSISKPFTIQSRFYHSATEHPHLRPNCSKQNSVKQQQQLDHALHPMLGDA